MSTQAKARRLMTSLNQRSRFSREDFEVKREETKLGDGLETIILTGRSRLPLGKRSEQAVEAGVRSHVQGPHNPGFTFSSKGSKLRPGPSLELGVHYTQVGFAGQKLNPMAEFLPSTAAFPIQTILNTPPVEDLVPFLRAF